LRQAKALSNQTGGTFLIIGAFKSGSVRLATTGPCNGLLGVAFETRTVQSELLRQADWRNGITTWLQQAVEEALKADTLVAINAAIVALTAALNRQARECRHPLERNCLPSARTPNVRCVQERLAMRW